MTAAALLDRLEKVKQTAPGRWIAACPAHEDKTPSLSIRELPDERVLLWDFGGCSVDAVLGALGLEMRDLYPEPLGHHFPPSRSRIPAADVLAALDHEIHVAALIASDLLAQKEINQATWDRLALAVSRIGNGRAIANPARVGR